MLDVLVVHASFVYLPYSGVNEEMPIPQAASNKEHMFSDQNGTTEHFYQTFPITNSTYPGNLGYIWMLVKTELGPV